MKNPLRQLLAFMNTTRNAYPNMPRVASSGDLVLDRRREWAMAASADGFHQAAAEIYEQILERAPYWALAWFELGDARRKLGLREGAIAAFEAANARDPDGLLAANLRLAALGAGVTPAAPPAAYVAGLFDQYAATFDQHLVEALDYRGPAILRAAMERACITLERPFHFDLVLDLGCGTGLMGVEIWKSCDVIRGVDLSPKMVEAAVKTGVYHSAVAGGIAGYLAAVPAGHADLVIAADVFVYLGDLAPVFAESARALEPDGLFAFSVQKGRDADYAVGDDMRYAHSASYLRALAAANGLDLVSLEDVSTRKDRDVPVPGLVAVMVKREGAHNF